MTTEQSAASTRQTDVLEQLRGGIVASCQAAPDDPLCGPNFMASMAQAVVAGGAMGVRIEGIEDIAVTRRRVSVPIIGLWKDGPHDRVYITPTRQHARAVVAVGADIVAVDATHRPREEPFAEVVAEIHALGKTVLADVATVAEGQAAADEGADAVASTLSGYTPTSPNRETPDIDLIVQLCETVDIPVIGEGHYEDPSDVKHALDAGALTVVLGATLTRPEIITSRLISRIF